MEGVAGDGGSPFGLTRWRNDFYRRFQYYMDKSTAHPVGRWLGSLAAATIYILQVYYVQGFYIISYGLGIYVFNLLIGFLSPQVDLELEGMDGPSLPTKGSDEFKTFIRRLPEFKFWFLHIRRFYTMENNFSSSFPDGFSNTPLEPRRTFQILVAATKEMGIGKDGKLPWKLPFDVKFFKEVTSSTSAPSRKNTLIMGRKTWESIADQF